MAAIRLEGVTKRFGDHAVLHDLSLDLPEGSFTALLGPSGCGKTTVLRLVAGFERPSEGRVLIDGAVVSTPGAAVPPEERGLGVVFQSYALWPHMTVAQNVAYPLQARRRPAAEISAGVSAALAQVGLGALADRCPDALSGGQRQRVALARAMVAEARAVLFDEPLANLDVHLRARLVEEFRRIHRETGRTMLYVTHDQAEAIALADRLVVMAAGRALQIGPPRQVYREPACATVAAFVGRGAVVAGTALAAAGGVAQVALDPAGAPFTLRCRPDARPGPCRVLLRPEDLALVAPEAPGAAAPHGALGAVAPHGALGAVAPHGALGAIVRRATYRGPVTEVEVALDAGGEVVLDADAGADLAPGAPVRLAVRDGWLIPEG